MKHRGGLTKTFTLFAVIYRSVFVWPWHVLNADVSRRLWTFVISLPTAAFSLFAYLAWSCKETQISQDCFSSNDHDPGKINSIRVISYGGQEISWYELCITRIECFMCVLLPFVFWLGMTGLAVCALMRILPRLTGLDRYDDYDRPGYVDVPRCICLVDTRTMSIVQLP